MELRSKVNVLESTLSKHLKSQAKIQTSSGFENRSLIDPATWASSDRSSPPAGPPILRPVHPERKPSNSNLATKTPAVPRRPQVPVAPTVLVPSDQATPLLARTPAPKRLPLALKAPRPPNARADDGFNASKPKFGKLARSSSELSQIQDFDPPACNDKSPVNLGKRNERPEPFEENAPKPVKRRYGTRSRTGTKQSQLEEMIEPPKAAEPPAAKRATRRRR